MIIQGSNAPILLTFESSMDSITDFSAALVSRKLVDKTSILKHWEKADIEVNETAVALPLTQEETMEFPSGVCSLEIKWVDEDNVHFADVVNINVEHRADKTKLAIGG